MILDIHLHSKYSDGLYSPRVIAKQAKMLDLDGFALTDHDTVDGLMEAKRAAKEFNLKFIPGTEVSSDQGHVLALGVDEVVGKGPLDETIERIHELGGIAIAPHPYDIFRHGVRNYVKEFKFDYIEAFNARTVFPTLNDKAEFEAKKLKMPMTAGSDAHNLQCMGLGTVWVDKMDDLYKGKAEMYRRKWAGILRIAVE